VICGRRQDKLDAALASLNARESGCAHAIQADLASPAAIEPLFHGAVERVGGLDILVVNSGHMAYGGLEELTEADWYHAFELVMMSAVRLARLAVPHMRERVGGDIVFVTASGIKEPSPHLVLSNAMRAGIASLAKTLSRAAAPDNIRVNVVAPGYFDTGRVRRRMDDLTTEERLPREQAATRVAGEVPWGRIGTAKEFGKLVAFLVSRQSAYLIGSTITIDGGSSRGLF
jgi:3-oxoacyl-[acyl-carrier protein] reductase